MIKKIAWGIPCIFLLLLSCESEETVSSTNQTAVSKTVGPCSAYRTLAPDSLANELNMLANCDPQYCDGTKGFAMDYMSGYLVNSSSGTDWQFWDYDVVSTGAQDSILQEARNYAISNNPAGYYIESFTFNNHVTHYYPYAFYSIKVSVWVRFRQCIGGGGPHS